MDSLAQELKDRQQPRLTSESLRVISKERADKKVTRILEMVQSIQDPQIRFETVVKLLESEISFLEKESILKEDELRKAYKMADDLNYRSR